MNHRSFRHRPGDLDAFLEGTPVRTEAPAEEAAAAPVYPWESARPDVQKAFNLRLPEKHLWMLRYIAEHTPDSMQTFCLKQQLPAIEAKVAELIRKEAEEGLR
jgi:hypothetical protein